ncbi:hypothetical protein [Photobacterium damselae]|uniref:hypothetical protein n=1 Tax=Photobacterium damselae TaxID=38293 RepID=UPI002F3EBEC3
MNNISFPPSVNNKINQLSISIDARLTAIENLAERLNSSSSESFADNATISTTTQYLCLHPYLFGVGFNDTLSAPTALQIAANAVVSSKTTHTQGIAMIVTGRDQSHFASQIRAISQVVTHPAWLQLSILSSNKSLLPITKMQIPRHKPSPSWTAGNLQFFNPLHDTHKTLHAANAHNIDAISPVERLITLANRQKKRLQQQQQALHDLREKYNGSCYAIRLSGSVSAMRKQLEEYQADNQPYSTVLLLLSDDDKNLSLLYEMFGL